MLSIFSVSVANSKDTASDLKNIQQQEISKLVHQIQLLELEVGNLNSKQQSPVSLDLQREIINSTFNDDLFEYKSKELQEKIFQERINKNNKKVSDVNVGGEVKITTQGQVSYVGSFSSNNSIPIGQLPSNLFASSILNQRGLYDDYAIFFGGFIETDLQGWRGSAITQRNGSVLEGAGEGVYLTAATLYFLANVGHYVTANLDFSASQNNSYNIQDAFFMIGNLDTSPFFLSVGKYRVSLGSFGGGGPWTTGLTANMFRPLRVANAAINYKGDTSNANFTVSNAGDHPTFSLAYFDAVRLFDIVQLGFNTGYMHDIRGANNRFSFVNKRVGEFNIDFALNLTNMFPGSFNLGAGWATTTNKSVQFNGISDSYAGAFTVQAAYTFTIFGSGQNINISYGHSYNAENIPMPLSFSASRFMGASGIKDQVLISTQRSFFDDNVLFGPEYSYQSLYNGQHMNTVTLDISVYI
ncbi:uncharacterized protein DUF3573 [Allofrancisella inopinata]|uniref:DUF3573 domain-containing protein n=1 Tax=Allofrancisella inopinata TaxID=1085647 RepID=A0AAE6YHE9_9GAMM|nr:DUF3573 domain-containing protein [Allofrancisella inopinata]QIV95606.1 DUF3573 domain-containing protein [Allofrancisella inopinata]TDT70705.1 uncharacterized protein DUF3573 [Allofrancisella inopinata]